MDGDVTGAFVNVNGKLAVKENGGKDESRFLT